MRTRQACIISFTPVTDEPRVLRQASALLDSGWEVTLCGFTGRQPKPAHCRLIEVAHVGRSFGLVKRILTACKLRLSRWNADFAEDYYWSRDGYAGIYQHIAYVEGRDYDFVAAHDYFAAPIAARLAAKCGAKYTVDCHEYAIEQYLHDPQWVKLQRPWIHALQKRFLPRAAVLTTVCDSIAEQLQNDYHPPTAPVVVRSTPMYQEMPFRPAREVITVLYHGLVCSMRGLEATIASVPLWRPEFRLIIRGPSTDAYRDSLRRLVAKHNVAGRVDIEPPVLASQMVSTANRADIGYFVQEDASRHKRFALPNKLFEYIMAGLALCVGDLPEMALVVRRHDVGRLVPGTDPEHIAAVINSLSRHEIDAYKRKSLQAAKELCWEQESTIMLDAYRRALG